MSIGPNTQAVRTLTMDDFAAAAQGVSDKSKIVLSDDNQGIVAKGRSSISRAFRDMTGSSASSRTENQNTLNALLNAIGTEYGEKTRTMISSSSLFRNAHREGKPLTASMLRAFTNEAVGSRTKDTIEARNTSFMAKARVLDETIYKKYSAFKAVPYTADKFILDKLLARTLGQSRDLLITDANLSQVVDTYLPEVNGQIEKAVSAKNLFISTGDESEFMQALNVIESELTNKLWADSDDVVKFCKALKEDARATFEAKADKSPEEIEFFNGKMLELDGMIERFDRLARPAAYEEPLERLDDLPAREKIKLPTEVLNAVPKDPEEAAKVIADARARGKHIPQELLDRFEADTVVASTDTASVMEDDSEDGDKTVTSKDDAMRFAPFEDDEDDDMVITSADAQPAAAVAGGKIKIGAERLSVLPKDPEEAAKVIADARAKGIHIPQELLDRFEKRTGE